MSSPATTSSSGGQLRQPSRLQRRAPVSLQIKPAASSSWNVAIPLLSPLTGSPPRVWVDGAEGIVKPREEHPGGSVDEPDKRPVFKRWQHPAVPSCYDVRPFVPPFVPV